MGNELVGNLFSQSKGAKKAKGNANLSFIIEDVKENMTLTLNSRKYKVSIQKFIDNVRHLIEDSSIRTYQIEKRSS